jgi:hypothetical protein
MTTLKETNPALVHAALEALKSIEPVEPGPVKETTFVHDGREWNTSMCIDLHGYTIEEFWITPA